MELTLDIIGITALWISTVIAMSNYNKSVWDKRKRNLRGRIVRLSDKFCKEHSTNIFGKIINVIKDDPKKQTLLQLEVQCIPDESRLKLAKEQYDKEYEKQLQLYDNQILKYKDRIKKLGNGELEQIRQLQSVYQSRGYAFYQQEYVEPRKPQYNFNVNSNMGSCVYDINRKDFKIMPQGFDVISGTVIKQIEKKTKKKGGEKSNKRMPRFFKWAFLLPLVIVAWDIATHFNDIALYIAHTFISGK